MASPRVHSRGQVQRNLNGRVMRAGFAAADNRLARRFTLLAGLAALGEHAARRTRMPAALAATLTTTHRMIDGVLRGTALMRLAAHPTLTACLAEADIHVIRIAHRADRRPAASRD